MKRKIEAMSDTDVLSLLAHLVNESHASLQRRESLRAGLYIHYAQKVIDIRGIQPMDLGDSEHIGGLVSKTGAEVTRVMPKQQEGWELRATQ